MSGTKAVPHCVSVSAQVCFVQGQRHRPAGSVSAMGHSILSGLLEIECVASLLQQQLCPNLVLTLGLWFGCCGLIKRGARWGVATANAVRVGVDLPDLWWGWDCL